MAILNTISINKKIQTLAQSKRFQKFMYRAAKTKLIFAKQDLLEEFDENEVIKEMIDSSNDPSINQSSIVSKGNITAFLGQEPGEGARQTIELKEILKNQIIMDDKPKIELKNNTAFYSFTIKMPTKSSLNEIAKLDWTTKSWIEIIETGISNTLKKFIFWAEGFNTPDSRSGTGLQTRGKVSNIAQLTPTPFITKILDGFREKFNK